VRHARVCEAGGDEALEQFGLEQTGELDEQLADVQALRRRC
jgi:hypothetical protein